MGLTQVFLPPELADQVEFEEVDGISSSGKENPLRRLYFARLHAPAGEADRDLVRQVLAHARQVIAHPSRPTFLKTESFLDNPFGELSIEDSLEETPFLEEPKDLLVQSQSERPFSCVTMLDASSSMSGEKHLLASIAVAVLLLEVQPRDASVIVFASDSKTIKPLLLEESPAETVLKFLKSNPRGFTNIAAALEEGLKQYHRAGVRKRKVGLLATDGRTTEGEDPVEAAKGYDFLVVLHLHGPGSHLESSQAIAQSGHGVCLEVEEFEELPSRLYDALKLLGRM